MIYSVYGTDNSKRLIIANDINQAYERFKNMVSSYMLLNYDYKIERYYKIQNKG